MCNVQKVQLVFSTVSIQFFLSCGPRMIIWKERQWAFSIKSGTNVHQLVQFLAGNLLLVPSGEFKVSFKGKSEKIVKLWPELVVSVSGIGVFLESLFGRSSLETVHIKIKLLCPRVTVVSSEFIC